jgi:hypothetical protein
MSTLATIPGDVWRRPTLGLMIVGSGILRPLCLFNASIVVRNSVSSESLLFAHFAYTVLTKNNIKILTESNGIEFINT